jgi:hypothetical protein
MIIDNEQAYPIYEVKFKWIYEDDTEDSTGWKVMFKNKLPNEEQQEKIKEYDEYLYGKYETKYNKKIKCMLGSMEFVEYETWCIQWFNHYTFDIGQTDEEVLDSFEKFVRRKTETNKRNGHYNNELNYNNELPYYCLMGAEDRWRWNGGDADNYTDPPCRCEGCKKNGLIRINH